MADESRTLYTGPTPPKPPSQIGETLFGILEENRKTDAKKDVLSFESDLRKKETEQKAGFDSLLETMKSQNRMLEHKTTFDMETARTDMLSKQLGAQTTDLISSMIGRGMSVPGYSMPTPPERAEHEPTSMVPVPIQPGGAAAASKDVSSILGEAHREQLLTLRNQMGMVSPDEVQKASEMVARLRETEDPMAAQAADWIDLASTPTSMKNDLFRATGAAQTLLLRHQSMAMNQKAKLDATAEISRELTAANNATRIAVAKIQHGGTLAEVKTAASAIMALNASHGRLTDAIRALTGEMGQLYKAKDIANMRELIRAKESERDTVAKDIRMFEEMMVKAQSRPAPSELEKSQRDRADRASKAAGIETPFDWLSGGTDADVVRKALSPADFKKWQKEYQKITP